MNATNPFQIPSCFQVDHERRRRERFKKTFIAVTVAGVALLIGLLIEGCMSEQAAAGARQAGKLQALAGAPAAAVAPRTVALPQAASPPALSQSASAVSKANTSPSARPTRIYVVKAGDNLTRIAHAHGTTVKALKAANGLASDQILIGAKLKLPGA